MAKKDLKAWQGAVLIPVDKISPDPLNPNVMMDDKFNKLVDMIVEDGFDEPIQVEEDPENDRYVLIGGEHRWKAAIKLGMKDIPATIKTPRSVEERRIRLLQRNMIRGDLDSAKFGQLINSVQGRFGVEEVQAQLCLRDGEMDKLLKRKMEEDKKEKEDAEDGEAGEKQEVAIVDNLGFVINEILSKYGDTAPAGFLFFAYKNRMHLIVQCDEGLYDQVKSLVLCAGKENGKMNSLLKRAISGIMESSGKRSDLDEIDASFTVHDAGGAVEEDDERQDVGF